MDDGCAAVHGWDSALLSGPIVFFFFMIWKFLYGILLYFEKYNCFGIVSVFGNERMVFYLTNLCYTIYFF